MENGKKRIDNQDNDKLKNNINAIFHIMTYYEKYNFDIWTTILIIFFVLFIALYFYIINQLRSFRAQWPKYKCNPLFMPFASVINPQKNVSSSENIKDNFNKCMKNITSDVVEKAKQPLEFAKNSIDQIFVALAFIAAEIGNSIQYILDLIISIYEFFQSRLRIIGTEINNIFINIVDFLGKILGMMSVLYYTIEIVLNSLKLIFVVFALLFFAGIVVPLIISVTLTWILFIALVAMLVMAIVWSWIPPFGVMAAFLGGMCAAIFVLALVLTVFMIICVIVHGILAKFGEEVLEATLPDAPSSKHIPEDARE